MKVRNVMVMAALLGLAGCGDGGGTGRVELRLEGEDGIREGLAAGGEESIVDGWSVSFESYVVAVGDVELDGGSGGPLDSHETFAVDLARSATGRVVAAFGDVATGAWPEVFYSAVVATADTVRDDSVDPAHFDRMVAEGCTYLIRGTISNSTGQRCVRGDASMCSPAPEIAFDLCVPMETTFGPCENTTGIEGLVVTEGMTTTAALTIHGDHLFFNGFPVGAEGNVARRAQWLANADVDADGTVTRSDLESITSSDFGALFPADPGDGEPGFDFGGSPEIDGAPIADAWGYLRAQLRTQGHFEGEGECAWDGTGHDH